MRPLTTACAVLLFGGCQCGPVDVSRDGGPGSGGSGGSNGMGGSNGTGGGSSSTGGGSTGTGGGEACAEVTSMANLGKKPVDIIVIIDNSGSMTAEIQSVEANVNMNFANVIENSGLDYRIILLSKHGSAAINQSVCISQPLSMNATCSPPPRSPVNGPKFFHYSTEIGSNDSLGKVLATYNAPGSDGTGPMGWSGWLRPDAYRTFIEITDDNEGMSAAAFDRQLTALMPSRFGSPQNRNYIFHSIIGVGAKPNPDEAYQPNEPVVVDRNRCMTAVNAGRVYQDLSILTGGLRFQMCEPDRYGTVFQTVARGVIASSQVACDFAIPPPPAGSSLSNRIYVGYTPGNGGAPTEFSQVLNAGACGAGKFYVENMRVVFCPETCTSVRTDPMAKVAVRFSCEIMIQ